MKVRLPERLGRVPLLLLGIAALVTGIWGGLVRLPMILPLPGYGAYWITYHGALMVCGFLGTVIALERAVGLRAWWTYAPPLLIGAGSLLMAAGSVGRPAITLITVGSLLFFGVTLYVVRLQRVTFTMVMSAGALAWVVGNALWWFGWGQDSEDGSGLFHRIVPWWIAFLGLTILGERLDLSRFQKQSPWSRPLLIATLALLAAGLLLCFAWQIAGERVLGASLFAMALWLGRFDIARRTVKQPGLPRFMALSLLVGYLWLGLAGAFMIAFSPLTSGLRYDAVLHAFFVGFVFSMIFAHAPVIFPAVLIVQPVFSTWFYSHVVLLETGLLLRIAGDLAASAPVRQWGAVLNGMAVALFLVNTIAALVLRAALTRKKSAKSLAPQKHR